MTGDFAAWVRIGIGAALLLIACVVRDVVARRSDAAVISEAMRSRR
jgi:hypothetical protein